MPVALRWGPTVGPCVLAPSPAGSLPYVCSGWLNMWAFLKRLHNSAFALPFARCFLWESNLPPGPFVSTDTAPAQRWKFPLRGCSRCLPETQTQGKSDGDWLPAPSQAEHPFLLSPCPCEASALPCPAVLASHGASCSRHGPGWELMEPTQLASL